MAEDKMEKRFTVQGVDPPVPVGEGGVWTGPPRPSSDDCPALPATNQAEVHAHATGEARRDPFKKSTRIFRSPIRIARSSSVGDMDWRKGAQLTLDDVVLSDADSEPGNTSKRKRTAGGEPDNLGSEPTVIEKLIMETLKEIKNLQRLVTDNTNTHKKIKEVSRKLTWLAEKIEREDIGSHINRKSAIQKPQVTRRSVVKRTPRAKKRMLATPRMAI